MKTKKSKPKTKAKLGRPVQYPDAKILMVKLTPGQMNDVERLALRLGHAEKPLKKTEVIRLAVERLAKQYRFTPA